MAKVSLCALSAVLTVLFLTGGASGQPDAALIEVPLGIQECNSQCQETHSDCIITCDQVVSCEQQCKEKARTCTADCTKKAEEREKR